MCVDLFGIAFYLIFGQGVIQEWAREPEPEETLGQFVRRISTIVRNLSSRRTSAVNVNSRRATTESAEGYSRMDESRNNSAEIRSKSPIPTIREIETSFNEENEKKPDRPEV